MPPLDWEEGSHTSLNTDTSFTIHQRSPSSWKADHAGLAGWPVPRFASQEQVGVHKTATPSILSYLLHLYSFPGFAYVFLCV